MRNNSPAKGQFTTSIFWNTIDSLGSQALITAHHFMFKSYIGSELHGFFASYLSLIYIFIPLLNMGLDHAISPHFNYFTKSKRHFKSLLNFQVLPQLAVMFILSLGVLLFFYLKTNIALALIMAITLVLELTRKSFRSFLQLTLNFKFTCMIEVAGALLYFALFWIIYSFIKTPDALFLAFSILSFSSLAQLIVLAIYSRIFFNNLPENQNDNPLDSFDKHKNIFKSRTHIWLNHLFNQLNYSNFIIPFSNMCFGQGQASIVAVLMNSARLITLFFQRSLGISSLAFWSNFKNLEAKDDSVFDSFKPIRYTYNFSLPLIVFFTINISLLSSIILGLTNSFIAYLIMILSIIEGIISIYEKAYISHGKANVFFNTNIINILLLGSLLSITLYNGTLPSFLITLVLIRILILLVVIFHYKFTLNLPHNYKINLRSIIRTIVVSVMFYIILKAIAYSIAV